MNKYKFPCEEDIIRYSNDEIYLKSISNLEECVKNNYDEVKGYLQEFFSINAVDRIIKDSDSNINGQWEDLKEKIEEDSSNSPSKKVVDNAIYSVLEDNDLFLNYDSYRNNIFGSRDFNDSVFDAQKRIKDISKKLNLVERKNDKAIKSSLYYEMISNCMDRIIPYLSSSYSFDTLGYSEDIKKYSAEIHSLYGFLYDAEYSLSKENYESLKNTAYSNINDSLFRNRNNIIFGAVFPEFISNNFYISDKQKEAASHVICLNDRFCEMPDEFKVEFKRVIKDSLNSTKRENYEFIK